MRDKSAAPGGRDKSAVERERNEGATHSGLAVVLYSLTFRRCCVVMRCTVSKLLMYDYHHCTIIVRALNER